MTRPLVRPSFAALLAVGALLLVGSGCSADASASGGDGPTTTLAPGPLAVVGATIDRPANPRLAAVRFEVRNPTREDDRLLAVSSASADEVSIHRSETDAQGRATMVAQEGGVLVRAGSVVTFEPGGLHVMLDGIADPLEVGDRVPLTFEFEGAGTVNATATVVEAGTVGQEGHDGH